MTDPRVSQMQMCFDYCTGKAGCRSVRIENKRDYDTGRGYVTCELLDIEWTGKEELGWCSDICMTYYQVDKGKNLFLVSGLCSYQRFEYLLGTSLYC